MRVIAIVGAGQAGLQTAIALLKKGFSVSLFTNRSAKQVLEGRILSSQGMFHTALANEKALGLNFWDDICPQNKQVTFSLGVPQKAQRALSWQGTTHKFYQSVDQRLKFSRWMKEFENLGGDIFIQDVGLSELNKIAKQHELTLVAGGKSEISQAFPINNVRSRFSTPQRALSCLYVKGVKPAVGSQGVRANIIPGVGEFFIMPGLTLNGSCEMMLFEGIPKGKFDCWHGIKNVHEQLTVAKKLLKEFIPWEAERCLYAEPTDEQAGLVGQYTPVIRRPCLPLPCGKYAFGLGDTVVLNDPIAGQGANSASKAAKLYVDSIIGRGAQPFDQEWMEETFELNWHNHAKWATKWSHLLLMPPAPHIVKLLSAAASSPTISNILANAFDDPSTLFPWIMDPEDTLHAIAAIEKEEQPPRQEQEEEQEQTKVLTTIGI